MNSRIYFFVVHFENPRTFNGPQSNPNPKPFKANDGHEYCLKTKYKNEFIKLNGENILLKEMQEKMIQQEGLCGSIKLQLAQDRIQVWVVHMTRNHPRDWWRSIIG